MKFKSISTKLQLSFMVILLIVLVIISTITFINLNEQQSEATKNLNQSNVLLNELVELKKKKRP